MRTEGRGGKFLQGEGVPPPDMRSYLGGRDSRGSSERIHSITEQIARLPARERDAVIAALMEIHQRHDPTAVERLEGFLARRGISGEPRRRMSDEERAQGPETRRAYSTDNLAFNTELRRVLLLDES